MLVQTRRLRAHLAKRGSTKATYGTIGSRPLAYPLFQRSGPSSLLLLALLLGLLAPLPSRAESVIPAESIRALADTLPEFTTTPFVSESEGNQIDGVVRIILPDSKGNLWFGGQAGLQRHDGKELSFFDLRDDFDQGITVRALVEDRAGNIWIGHTGGLTRFDGRNFTSFFEDDGLPTADVWSLFVDDSGTLWIGTPLGPCRYDGERFAPFPLPPGRIDPNKGVSSPQMVWSFVEDGEGHLWFAGEGVVFRFDGKKLTHVPIFEDQSATFVRRILADRNGALWFVSSKGLFYYEDGTFERRTGGIWRDGLGGGFEDSRGHLWFTVMHEGVFRYDGSSLTRFAEAEGLTSLGMFDFAEDREGRVWCGGWMGAFRFENGSFVNVTRDGPW